MTRLKKNDIAHISSNWKNFENKLHRLTGANLLKIASNVCNISDKTIIKHIKNSLVAIVPIKAGEGIIEGFAESILSICKYLGFNAFITTQTDDEGYLEAKIKGASCVISSDDDDYLIKSLNSNFSYHNDQATAYGFAEILSLMAANDLKNKQVLLVGCGKIGTAAAEYLNFKKANIIFMDIDTNKAKILANKFSGDIQLATEPLAAQIKYIFDASPATQITYPLTTLPKNTIISAPGVPYIWEGYQNAWHDPLQTGTAIMLIKAACDK